MPSVVGIIDTISALPIGVLTPLLDHNGPYGAGIHSLTTWNDSGTTRAVGDTFGVVVQINGAIAPKLGRDIGYDDGAAVNFDEYDLRIVQVAALHQMFGGAWIGTQLEDLHFLPALLRWAEAVPGKIGLYVSPTWSVDLYFLRAL